MKDSRNLMLSLLSVGMIATWVYHLSDKARYSNMRHEVYIKDSAAIAQGIGDSLNKFYSSGISDLEIKLDSLTGNNGRLQGQLNNKLIEINRLKSEISTILKRSDLTKNDLAKARLLTTELRARIEELQNQNKTIEEEKKQIASDFDQLNTKVSGLTQTNAILDKENKTLTEKMSEAGFFIASEIKLSAIQSKGNKEIETNKAKNAEKFAIACLLQNNVNSYENSEVIIILTDPNNQVLEYSAWDAGSFETKNEGRKKYTRKTRFAYNKGEPYQVSFTMNAPAYVKGNYVLQIYHNGVMIGRKTKVLR
jgi:hypothetical protein